MSKKNVIEIESAEPKRPDNSTKRKTSKRQLEACRANGAKSHGPKTDEGKAISRLNAVKHNLYSDLSTLKGEDQQLYEQYQLDHTARFDPRDTIERDLVAKMAHNSWRQNRACLIEAELFDIKMSDQAPTWDRLPGGVRETTSMALAYKEMVEEGRALESLHRHEASLVRQYNMYFKLYTEFRKRNDLPPIPASNPNCGNEPNPKNEHLETEPTGSTPTNLPCAQPSEIHPELTTDHCPLTTDLTNHQPPTTNHFLTTPSSQPSDPAPQLATDNWRLTTDNCPCATSRSTYPPDPVRNLPHSSHLTNREATSHPPLPIYIS